MAGWKGLNARKERLDLRVQQRLLEVAVYDRHIDWKPPIAAREDAFDLGSEQQSSVTPAPVQRLDPEWIAGEQQAACVLIEPCQGPHAVEPGERLRPPVPDGLEDNLRVAA